ncbi:MAG: AAA family ATPase [Lachnospiraceae bacterium]|nr:AAA family ATPase [Lachnospiraceae bacterium]
MRLITVLAVIALFMIGFTRCIILNLPFVGFYSVYDVWDYVRKCKWRNFNFYGIDMFIGMFGHGKTLSATHKARMIYKKFGNRVRFLSNYQLKGIPYIPLTNFQQIVELADTAGAYSGTVVLIDEIEDVLSHRNYKDFPLAMLNVITQQRKLHVYIMCTAQRFFMVDKLFRGITTHVIDCNKYWRLQHMNYYDAWDYENAMNTQLLKPVGSRWWFVRNRDYECYDTAAMIENNSAEKFISNEEALARIGFDTVVNADAVARPSKILRKARKVARSRPR